MSPQQILFIVQPVTNLSTVPMTLLAALIQVESDWNPSALGDKGTSIGLFQLHIGGQADQALKDGHQFSDLADPLLNATYALPFISSAWEHLGGWSGFHPQDITWWQQFGSLSGHPGGVAGVDPANIAEASRLYEAYNSPQGLGMVQLSQTGEVGDFLDVDQMQTGYTEFACVYFSFFIFYCMAQVGSQPAQSVPQVIKEALAAYAADHNGDDLIDNTAGASLDQLYALIVNNNRHFQAANMDSASIRAWVRLGYPVEISVAETSVFDMQLGGNPYPWTPAGNHAILVTGVASDGNFLVRDPANCTNLFDPNSLRPGPRHYDASKLQYVSATALVPPWLPRPPAGYDPLKDAPFMGVPQNWTDDGTTLTAPNGQAVTKGERDFILNYPGGWHSWNVPIEAGVDGVLVEESNPSLGYGYRHLYEDSQIEWTQQRGGFFEGWVGQELQAVRKSRDAAVTQVKALQTQVQALQAQIAAQQSGIPAALQTAINTADADMQQLDALIKPYVTPPQSTNTGAIAPKGAKQ